MTDGIFMPLCDAIEWITGPRPHWRSAERRNERAFVNAHGIIYPLSDDVTPAEYRAVSEIEDALRAGRIAARGSWPNSGGMFADIAPDYWQYAKLDPGRSVTRHGRSPIAEQSQVTPIRCYDRILLWRDEVESTWPKSTPQSATDILNAAIDGAPDPAAARRHVEALRKGATERLEKAAADAFNGALPPAPRRRWWQIFR